MGCSSVYRMQGDPAHDLSQRITGLRTLPYNTRLHSKSGDEAKTSPLIEKIEEGVPRGALHWSARTVPILTGAPCAARSLVRLHDCTALGVRIPSGVVSSILL